MANQQWDDTNRFTLWPNDRRESEKHPDLTGTINIDGKDHFFDAWVKWDGNQISRINGKIGKAKIKGKSGGSGNTGGTRKRQELGADQRRQPVATNDFDDSDIPF